MINVIPYTQEYESEINRLYSGWLDWEIETDEESLEEEGILTSNIITEGGETSHWYIAINNEDGAGFGWFDEIGRELVLYVDPEYRQRGIGKAIVSKIVEKAREIEGLDELCGLANKKNEPSVRIFRSLGFKERKGSFDGIEFYMDVR